MANWLQLALLAVAALLTVAGAVLMNMFFGLTGVALMLVLTGVIGGGMLYLGGGGSPSGSANRSARRRQSKGARGGRRER